MPLVVPKEKGARGLYETSYDLVWANHIEDLRQELSELLKHNLDKNATYLFSVKGGPVYDESSKRWYQAYVSHRNY